MLTDEFRLWHVPLFFAKYVRLTLTRRPLLVHFEVTTRCNARCGFCDYWKTPADERRSELATFADAARFFNPMVITFTNSDYYLRRMPKYLRGELTEPCRSGIRTIHVDPTGHVKRCPDFPVDFHWREFRKYRPIDCNACYYACRGEAEAPLRLSRIKDIVA